MKEWFIGLRRGLILMGSIYLLHGIIFAVVMGSGATEPAISFANYVLIVLSSLMLGAGLIGVKMNKALPKPFA
jgi:hypothetical protein